MINWKIRYGKILALFPELRDPAKAVLEVGAGGSGLRNYLPRPVVSTDLDYAHARSAGAHGVAADATRLPFADGSFDFVLCLDTLEHIAAASRAEAIRELARVGRKKLIIGLPMGAAAAWGDEQYQQFLCGRNVPTPIWLAEHLTLGVPSIGSILRYVAELGRPFLLHGNETLIQHYAGLLADEVPFLRQANSVLGRKHSDSPPISAGEGDVYYSYLVEVDETATRSESLRIPAPLLKKTVADAHESISLYCVGHDPERMLPLNGYRYFFVGKVRPDGFPKNITVDCDDQALSIRERNPQYSEMTAIYSVWKNARHGDYVGFCHYRRLFDFAGGNTNQRNQVISTRNAFEQERPAMEAIQSCRPFLAQGGVVVALEDTPQLTVAEHYMHDHLPNHYILAINFILEHYPHLAPYALRQFESNRGYFNNMFLCPADFFNELCTWWFDALFHIEAHLMPSRDPYQKRAMAFLSERLLDMYLRWRFATGTPRHELPIFFLADSVFSASH
jgi:SAM-dependent methyltransferase